MTKLDTILDKLAIAQHRLLRSADSIPADQWKTSPGNGAWSAAQLIAHLIMVERKVIGTADHLQQKSPKHFSLLRRIHLPMKLVEARIIKRKAPIPVDPELVNEKETMLAELREVRERTLAFIEETRGRDLSVYCWAHPFLGNLNTYTWFQMIAAHEVRHEKQMQEIAARLPKRVEVLHI